MLQRERDEYESRCAHCRLEVLGALISAVAVQLSELGFIKQSLRELEAKHGEMRRSYEDELARLRYELKRVRRNEREDSE